MGRLYPFRPAGKLTEADLDARQAYLSDDTLVEPWRLPHVERLAPDTRPDSLDELVARYLRAQGAEQADDEAAHVCPFPATCRQGRNCLCGAVDATLLAHWPPRVRRIAALALAAWLVVGIALAAVFWPAAV